MTTPEQRAKFAAYMRGWVARNPEKVRISQEKHKEYLREYRKRNRTKLKEAYKKYYEVHRDTERLRQQRWRKLNTDKVNATAQRRRARKRSASIEGHLANVIKQLYLKSFCYWCTQILTPKNRTVDHVIPLSRGGHHVEKNLVACCGTCNRSKGNKFYWEWDGELSS